MFKLTDAHVLIRKEVDRDKSASLLMLIAVRANTNSGVMCKSICECQKIVKTIGMLFLYHGNQHYIDKIMQ